MCHGKSRALVTTVYIWTQPLIGFVTLEKEIPTIIVVVKID